MIGLRQDENWLHDRYMSDDNKIMISKVAPFGLRLLPKLKKDLDDAADANGRSLNAEITARLEWSIAAEEDFAKYQAKLEARSELAAQRILSASLTSRPDPVEERFKELEGQIAALKDRIAKLEK